MLILYVCFYVFVSISGRDLWWAVCPRGGTWPAVCPHGPRVHCHPWITTRWRHTEQVRDTKWAFMCMCAHLYPVLGNDTVLLLCVTDGTALFLLTINKERHTSPHCQMWVQICPILTLRRRYFLHFAQYIHHYFLHYLSVQGLGGSWEAQLYFASKDPWRNCN